MPAKRKLGTAAAAGTTGRRVKKDDAEQDAQGSESDADYEPGSGSGSGSDSSSESDAPTSSENESDASGSSSDSDSDSGIDEDSDQTGDDSNGDSDGADGDESGDEKSKAKAAVVPSVPVGRVVTGGKTLRPVLEKSEKEGAVEDNLKLADLGCEIFLLDKARSNVKSGTGAHRAAFVKGRVFLAGDRVLLNGHWFEIVGFCPDLSVVGHWLYSSDQIKKTVRHGNYLRALPPVTIKLDSTLELLHGDKAHTGPTATLKITHECTASTASTDSTASTEQEKEKTASDAKGVSGADCVLSRLKAGDFKALAGADKGRNRPALYTSERRWNAGEQKKLLMFVRRVWPNCSRNPDITVPMRPDPKKDRLSAPDDNDDDKKEIDVITSKYRSIWTAVTDPTNLPHTTGSQRWIANTFDNWRRAYISVTQLDWETSFREFWATADLVALSLLP